MLRLIKSFRKNKEGAIAVETAIVMPVMLAILLPSIDIGLQVYTLQQMNKATDSGIEYVVNGGRNEVILRNIVQDSFGGRIAYNELSVDAYCGCIVESQPSNGGGQNNDPNAGFYIKTPTQLSDEMCPAACDNGDAPSELVEVSLSRLINGTITDKQVNSRLQTRIK